MSQLTITVVDSLIDRTIEHRSVLQMKQGRKDELIKIIETYMIS